MIKTLLFATATIFTVNAAHADDTFGVPVTAELIDGWQQADGTRVGAIRITLADGWKTYWRAPGDAGIPPHFTWDGSSNLAGVSVGWPTPEVFVQNGMRSVGYSNQVTLPLTFAAQKTGQPVDINLDLEIGVCKDICVPKTLSISGTLDSAETSPVPTIAAAMAERPYTAREAGARGVTCAISPSKDGLNITATMTLPATGGREHVVIEAGRPDVWVSEATSTRSGNTLTAQAEMIAGAGGAFALDRSAIRFTVLGSSHAVDLQGCVPG
ncbi:protein-disulfide reductase DsbD domain-containing protein [Sulfitobacter guttiformis]|uniref:Disulfide bond corrector protein DsbC n=1 Tax=Sulfitobacter guttiformis TaxID=74349 RepID=A0A420DQG2_9RHOB|nr:protein-disulfide reductase DsbD domain-containing protein [Sulfitobacter guttiformis]KIN73769.1 DsbC domain containing protein [Sulfitobacter guttiformis KCTC 32187]RKE96403.1 disulfide bond corrector protein DsbC [Sulfitobacter guttiformis]